MKVYILLRCYHGESEVYGVYSSRERAVAATPSPDQQWPNADWYDIEEFEVDKG